MTCPAERCHEDVTMGRPAAVTAMYRRYLVVHPPVVHDRHVQRTEQAELREFPALEVTDRSRAAGDVDAIHKDHHRQVDAITVPALRGWQPLARLVDFDTELVGLDVQVIAWLLAEADGARGHVHQ